MRFVLGFLGAAATGAIYLFLQRGLNLRIPRWMLVALLYPAGHLVAGFVEMVSGIPFGELSYRWDSLAGWQRGVLGTGIVVLLLGVLVAGMAVVLPSIL